MRQLSLFDDVGDNDITPLPLIVAERWGFQLRYAIQGGQYWYAIRDWIAGLIDVNDPKHAWQEARKATGMQPILNGVQQVRLPGTKGSPTQVLNDKGLYHIAANLLVTKNREALSEIKEYLARAGAFTDLMRRDSKARAELAATSSPEEVLDATVKRYEKMGRNPNWISARLEGVVTRKEFTSALSAAVLDASKALYGKSTEKVYAGLWQRTTAMLRGDLDMPAKGGNVRDHFGEYALIYTRLAEKVATDKLKDAEVVTEALAMDIVYAAARLIREQANATSRDLGIDLVTEKPLLPQSDDDYTKDDFEHAIDKSARQIAPKSANGGKK